MIFVMINVIMIVWVYMREVVWEWIGSDWIRIVDWRWRSRSFRLDVRLWISWTVGFGWSCGSDVVRLVTGLRIPVAGRICGGKLVFDGVKIIRILTGWSSIGAWIGIAGATERCRGEVNW